MTMNEIERLKKELTLIEQNASRDEAVAFTLRMLNVRLKNYRAAIFRLMELMRASGPEMAAGVEASGIQDLLKVDLELSEGIARVIAKAESRMEWLEHHTNLAKKNLADLSGSNPEES